jgi:diguanylate cyclase
VNEIEIVRRWNQRFLYLFWFAVGLYTALAVTAGMTQSSAARDPLLLRVVVHPVPILILLVGALQIASRQFPTRLPIFLVIGMYIAVYIVAAALYDLVSPIGLLIIPMMFSTIYLRRDIIIAASAMSLLEFGLLDVLVYRPNHTISLMDGFVILGLLTVAAAVGFMIVSRGRELSQSLRQSIEARQDLMMQNVWMQRMSKFDSLTELYNRSAFRDHVNRLVEVCTRHDIALHLAVIDIDDFKHINDTFGHDVGDRVLKDFASHMSAELAETCFVARYGGEEFVAVGTELPHEQFVQVLETFRRHVAECDFSGHYVTVSIGIHTYIPGESADVLFRMADQGLYWSKSNGKNKLGFGEMEPVTAD